MTYKFSVRCVTPGHVLVAPIRVAERNKDLTDEEAEDFYKSIRLVQKVIYKNICLVSLSYSSQKIKGPKKSSFFL